MTKHAVADEIPKLIAITSHVADHPDLCEFDFTAGHRLQLICSRDDRGSELIKWAKSLDGPRIEVADLDERAHVHVHGSIDDYGLVVSVTVPGLFPALGYDAFTRRGYETGGRCWISLAGLEEFVEHGHAPEPIEAPEDAVPSLSLGR